MDFDPAMVQVVQGAARAAGVPVAFALGIAQQESQFDPRARNAGSGAVGLMQVLPLTADWMLGRPNGTTTDAELYDPDFNATAGTKFLAWLLKRYNGDAERAAAAYNWGPGYVSPNEDWDSLDARMPSETKKYWRHVMNFASAWTGKLSQAAATVANAAEDLTQGFQDQASALGWDKQSGGVTIGLVVAGVVAIGLLLWVRAQK